MDGRSRRSAKTSRQRYAVATLQMSRPADLFGGRCNLVHACDVPSSGPEVQRLGYYLGTWRGEGETKGGPFGPAGKLSSTTTCEWFAGGFQLVCRGEERGSTGKRTFLNVRAYDETAEAYTEYGISSFGESEYDTGGSIVGNKKTKSKGSRPNPGTPRCRCRRRSSHTRPTRRSMVGHGR